MALEGDGWELEERGSDGSRDGVELLAGSVSIHFIAYSVQIDVEC